MKLDLKKDGCHICTRWTALTGCDHYGPQDADKNEPIIKEIVKGVHGGNAAIVETADFRAGINATLIFLRQNNLLKALR